MATWRRSLPLKFIHRGDDFWGRPASIWCLQGITAISPTLRHHLQLRPSIKLLPLLHLHQPCSGSLHLHPQPRERWTLLQLSLENQANRWNHIYLHWNSRGPLVAAQAWPAGSGLCRRKFPLHGYRRTSSSTPKYEVGVTVPRLTVSNGRQDEDFVNGWDNGPVSGWWFHLFI